MALPLTRRYRAVIHIVDLEPWRNESCPQCKRHFTANPRTVAYDGSYVHFECSEAYMERLDALEAGACE